MALMNRRAVAASDSAKRAATTSVMGWRPLIHSRMGHESRTRVFKFALLFSEGCKLLRYVATGALKLLPGSSLRQDNLLPAYFQGQLGAFGKVQSFANLLGDGDLALGRDCNFIHRCILPWVRRPRRGNSPWGSPKTGHVGSLQNRPCKRP